MRRIGVAAMAIAVVAAACSSGDSDPSDEASGSAAVNESAEGILTDERMAAYLEQADLVPLPASDASAPAELPDAPGGATGYTRYVFREYEGEVLTSVVEGPLGEQVRCQDPDLPCSYTDLVDLYESGDDIPDELELTRDELATLIVQLTQTKNAVDHYSDPDTACADGFVSDRTQTPNMGTHFFNMDRILDGKFDPAEPEIIMYARVGGAAPEGQLGQCRDGRWDGEELESVAAAFILLTGATGEHPDGYAGAFDNWHVHYNLCRGAGVDSIAPRDVCEEQGGTFYPTLGWMMHAWTSEEYDNQLGVFSMWNSSVWPATDPATVRARYTSIPDDAPEGAAFRPIESFSFGRGPITVEAGKPVYFTNTDSVAHTVTAGSPDDPGGAFDSGVFAPGESYEVTLDEPGEYSLFCTLHPDMQATIVVE